MNKPARGATVARTLSANRTRIAATALAAGWAFVLSDDLDIVDLPMSLRIHSDLLWLLSTGTIVLAVAWVVRGRLMYTAMKLGRQVQLDASQPARRFLDGPTVGMGIAETVPPLGARRP